MLFYVRHGITVKFEIFIYEIINIWDKSGKQIEIKEEKKTEGSVNDEYKYTFELDEGYNFFIIGVQLDRNLTYLSILFLEPNKEENPIKTYEIDYSTEIDIDQNDLFHPPNYLAFYLRSKESRIGDTYIKLKVKKDVTDNYFYIGGYGYYKNPDKDEKFPLDLEYKNKSESDNYIIYEYYFNLTKEYQNFYMNVYIYEKIDYLSIKFDNENKSNDDDDGISPAVLAIIIIVCIIIVGIIVYFVFRKLGLCSKNEISSKDIESANQILQ